jgi:hypothetical protein
VKELRREVGGLKELVTDLSLENRLFKERMARPGDDTRRAPFLNRHR